MTNPVNPAELNELVDLPLDPQGPDALGDVFVPPDLLRRIFLNIDDVSPKIVIENRDVEVSFRLESTLDQEVSGQVSGTIEIEGVGNTISLPPTPSIAIPKGASVNGTLRFRAPPAGAGYRLRLFFDGPGRQATDERQL